MMLYKCKNSVFCGFLLLCFSVGTICGVLFFRVLLVSSGSWMTDYFIDLTCSDTGSFLKLFCSRLRPFLIISVLSACSFRFRLIPVLVFLRGCAVSYFFSAAFCAGCTVFSPACGFLVSLSAYLWLCCRLFFLEDPPIAQCFVFSVLIAALSALIQFCTQLISFNYLFQHT